MPPRIPSNTEEQPAERSDRSDNSTVAPDMTDRPSRIDDREEITGPRKRDTPTPSPELPELARAYGARSWAREGVCPQPKCNGRELHAIARGVGFCPSCVSHYATR